MVTTTLRFEGRTLVPLLHWPRRRTSSRAPPPRRAPAEALLGGSASSCGSRASARRSGCTSLVRTLVVVHAEHAAGRRSLTAGPSTTLVAQGQRDNGRARSAVRAHALRSLLRWGSQQRLCVVAHHFFPTPQFDASRRHRPCSPPALEAELSRGSFSPPLLAAPSSAARPSRCSRYCSTSAAGPQGRHAAAGGTDFGAPGDGAGQTSRVDELPLPGRRRRAAVALPASRPSRPSRRTARCSSRSTPLTRPFPSRGRDRRGPRPRTARIDGAGARACSGTPPPAACSPRGQPGRGRAAAAARQPGGDRCLRQVRYPGAAIDCPALAGRRPR